MENNIEMRTDSATETKSGDTKLTENIKNPIQTEFWKDVPPKLMSGFTNYKISQLGNVMLSGNLIQHDKNTCFKNKYGFYKTISLSGRPIYLHRLVYKVFNNDMTNNRVLFNKYVIDKDGYIECPLSSLYSIKSSSNDISADILNNINQLLPVEAKHPIYGTYKMNTWTKVIGHSYYRNVERIKPYDDYEIMIIDTDIEFPYLVRSNKRAIAKYIKIFQKMDQNLNLRDSNGKDNKYQLTHVLLSSFFPSAKPEPHVDHIDDNPNNHDFQNLQWSTIGDNCKKGQAKSTLTPRKGVKIKTIYPDGITTECRSICNTAREVHEYFKSIQLEKIPSEKTIENKIKLCMRGDIAFYYKLKFVDISENGVDLPNEHWLPYPPNNRYKVSDMGRIRDTNGHIASPYRTRGRKYSSFKIDRQAVYVHILVWRTFKGPIPEDYIVRHDDLAPLHNGLYRNYLIDLQIGKRPDNNNDYHEANRIKSLNASSTVVVSDSAVASPTTSTTSTTLVKNMNSMTNEKELLKNQKQNEKEDLKRAEQLEKETLKLKTQRDKEFLNFLRPKKR